MKQDITLAQVQALKQELEEKIQATGVGSLVKEFYDNTGIRVNGVCINWIDTSSYREIGVARLGLLSVEYEKISI